MIEIRKELKEYIENNVLPRYRKNDSGHGVEHINYVIKRCIKFSNQFPNINIDMLYTIASFHDISHHIDKNNHEVLSAKMFFEDEKMKEFFTEEQRKIIKEAIEDHCASNEYEPRSDYGKIISSADRTTNIDSILKRTYSYTKKHYCNLELFQIIERSYEHVLKKYGSNGYTKNYCIDSDYDKFKEQVKKILMNKWDFSKRYMEVNGISDIKEKAKIFAINAHKYQIRKIEPDKPMIIHPLSVGMMLEEYGYDDNIIAAGYLHDVVEDTKYTINYIKMEFGEDVASLVMGASEPDKSLSWEERKMHAVEEIKKLPLRNKLVICADKINNLEDLMIKFQKNGNRDFSLFARGEIPQKWYYTNIYKSLVCGEDESLPIFQRLKDVLDIVFGLKEDLFLKDTIFDDNKEYYEKLKKLHAQKVELQRLKSLCMLSKPFVIEFSGTPRTGKTTMINNLYDFFKKGGFDVSIIEEFTTSKYYKEQLKKELNEMSIGDSNIAIIEHVHNQLKEELNSGKEIILIDRSINDRQIWNHRRYLRGDMDIEQYLNAMEKYSSISKDSIDSLVITYAESLVSLKRDYNSSLSLEQRTFLNMNNLDEYNSCLMDLTRLFELSVENFIFIDTTSVGIDDASIEAASKVMPAMRKKYIETFSKKYGLE